MWTLYNIYHIAEEPDAQSHSANELTGQNLYPSLPVPTSNLLLQDFFPAQNCSCNLVLWLQNGKSRDLVQRVLQKESKQRGKLPCPCETIDIFRQSESGLMTHRPGKAHKGSTRIQRAGQRDQPHRRQDPSGRRVLPGATTFFSVLGGLGMEDFNFLVFSNRLEIDASLLVCVSC